jgi:DNA-directed RNA polymerase subunit M/transcription elongation factor TFIIS
MINKNETLHFGRRHHRKPRAIDGDNDVNEEKHDEVEEQEEDHHTRHEQHRPREHNKKAFYNFMRKHVRDKNSNDPNFCLVSLDSLTENCKLL